MTWNNKLFYRIPSVPPFPLFEISYLWYTFTGTVVAIIVGIIVSYITGFNDPKTVDKNLITPVVQNFFYEEEKEVIIVNINNTTLDEKKSFNKNNVSTT